MSTTPSRHAGQANMSPSTESTGHGHGHGHHHGHAFMFITEACCCGPAIFLGRAGEIASDPEFAQTKLKSRQLYLHLTLSET